MNKRKYIKKEFTELMRYTNKDDLKLPIDMTKTDTSKTKVQYMLNLIRKGYSKNKAFEKFGEAFPEIESQRRTNMYWQTAMRLIANNFEQDLNKVRAMQIERIEELLRDALESKDRSSALNALNMINKLYALYVEKKEVKAEVNEWKFDYSDEDN